MFFNSSMIIQVPLDTAFIKIHYPLFVFRGNLFMMIYIGIYFISHSSKRPDFHGGKDVNKKVLVFFWSTNCQPVNYIAFLPEAEGTTVLDEITVEIPATRSIHIEDVVGSLFGESRPGALRLRSEFAFEAQSRTYNSGDGGGTFGQGIPAVMDEAGESGWALIGAANRVGDDGVRCNLGLFNTRDDDDEVLIMVFDQATGDTVGGVERVNVGPYGWVQVNVFELMGEGDMEVDNAVILVLGSQGVRGYLSRIDNRSGDGTFILPVAAESVYSIPAEWEVTLTLNYSFSVTVDTLVYTGEDGEDVIVTNPEDGWTTTLHFMSPAEFCYGATCTADSNAGQVIVEVLRTRGDDSGHLHTSLRGMGDGETISVEDCFDLP